MESRSRRELAKWVLVTLTVLLATYAITYRALVRPLPQFVPSGEFPAKHPIVFTSYSVPNWISRPVETFFHPLNQLDRRIRPDVWHPGDQPELR